MPEIVRPAEFKREIWPGIIQEIRPPVVETKLPDFSVQVALAKNSWQLSTLYRQFSPDGRQSITSSVDLQDGRLLVVHAPPKVKVVKRLSEAQKSTGKTNDDYSSDAVYPVEYKTDGLWFLVQYLHGSATRHMHPKAIEAFTLISGQEYGIHDETADKTQFFTPNGTPIFVYVKESNRDHQCFSFLNPSLAVIVLVGENVEHIQLPLLSRDYLIEKAARARIATSEV